MPARKPAGPWRRPTEWSETSRIERVHARVRQGSGEWRKAEAAKSQLEVALDLLTVCRHRPCSEKSSGVSIVAEAQVAERSRHADETAGDLAASITSRNCWPRGRGVRSSPGAL